MSILKREPAVVIGVVVAFLIGGFNALGDQGILDPATVASIAGILLFGLPIIQGIVTRFFVSPAT